MNCSNLLRPLKVALEQLSRCIDQILEGRASKCRVCDLYGGGAGALISSRAGAGGLEGRTDGEGMGRKGVTA